MEFTNHRSCCALSGAVAALMQAAELPSRTRRLRRQSLLWDPSARPDRLFLIEQGEVDVYASNAAGEQVLLERVQPGRVFGEICLCALRLHEHGTSAVAVGTVQLREARYADFRRRLGEDAALNDLLIAHLCDRSARLAGRVRVLSEPDARERLLKALMYLARPVGGGGWCVEGSQQFIAETAGLSRAHSSVMLNALRRERVIRYERGGPIVLGRALVRRIEEEAGDED